jgi:hypoxia up-regulated 1
MINVLYFFSIFLILAKNIYTAASGGVIGIDFGTEYIKIAFHKSTGTFQMVENLQSKTKTPFALGFKDNERFFGAEAQVKKSKIPELVFTKMHEFLGKRSDDENLKKFISEYFVSYNIEEDSERKVYKFGINANKDGNSLLSIEEVFGMMFKYIKFLSQKFSQTEINECVVTVPAFYGYKQRLSISQSAEIAGLKLLHITTENTGAAVNYAMSHRFGREEKYIVFFNVGAAYTQASLVSFYSNYENLQAEKNSKNKKESTKSGNKIVEHQFIKIIDETWNDNAGGRNFDYNLVKYLMKEFYSKKGEKDSEGLKYLESQTDDSNEFDFKKYSRIAEKIIPSAIKYKEILSANKEALVNILGVEEGENLVTTISRSMFEKISQKDFDKIYLPFEDLLKRNPNITIDKIEAIEFIGGGSRVPLIKETFKNNVPANKIGTHMNGDDCFALGATYIASNSTFSRNGIYYNNKKAFLDKFGTNYKLKIKLETDTEKLKNNEIKVCDANTTLATDCLREINKQAEIFKLRSGFELKKSINFKHDSDFIISFNEVFDYPVVKEQTIKRYRVKVSKAFPKMQADKSYNQTIPKVHLKISTDRLGVISLKAEISYDSFLYVFSYKDEKGKYRFKYSLEKIEPFSASELIEKIQEVGANDKLTKAEKDNLISKFKNEVGKIKQTSKGFDLEVEEIHDIYPLPLTKNQIIESKVKLNSFDSIDEVNAQNAEKRNQLEGILYNKRDWVESEEATQYGTAEELQEFKQKLNEVKEWYEKTGYKMNAKTVGEKINHVNSLFSKFQSRIDNLKRRNTAIDYFNSEMSSTYKEAKEFVDAKTWTEEYFKNEFTSKFESIKNWLNEKLKEQEKIPIYEVRKY